MFNKNTKNTDRVHMMQQLSLQGEERSEKYLGLQMYIGQSRATIFAYIKDTIGHVYKDGKKNSCQRFIKKY